MGISFSDFTGGTDNNIAFMTQTIGSEFTINTPAGIYTSISSNPIKLNGISYAGNSETAIFEEVTSYEVLYEVDETSFSAISEFTAQNIVDIATGTVNGVPYIVGMGATNDLVYSKNKGETYSTISAGVSTLGGIAIGNNLILIATTDGNVYSWTESSGSTLVYSSGISLAGQKGLKYIGGKFFLLVNDGTVSYSSDGVAWTNVDVNITGGVYNVWYNATNGRYEFQGYNNSLNSSYNSWTTDFVAFTPLALNLNLGNTRFGSGSQSEDGKHRTICNSTNSYYASDDYGATWRVEGSLPNSCQDTFTDGTIWIACGAPYVFHTSRDGYTWTTRTINSSGTWQSVHAGFGRILLGYNVDPHMYQSNVVPFAGATLKVEEAKVLS